jgi:hypothetical protein
VPFEVLFGIIVTARFLLPLLILRYPLPAIIGCLVLDAVDQTVFQAFGYDPPFYQGYDKAMDVFYLGVAYVSSLRNWTNLDAFNVSRFLFFYRQIGVVAFELSQVRALLLVFPNTFEYFFIAYEAIRSRWSVLRYSLKFWVGVAAFIWIVIKLPQEYWIHVAQLDFTDTVKNYAWFGPLIVVGLLALLVILWFVVRPRLDPVDHGWELKARRLPEGMSTAAERDAWVAAHGKVFSEASLEKIFLIGLLSVIFGEVLPGVSASPLQVFVGIAVFVILNAATGLWSAGRGRGVDSVLLSFVIRLVVNFGLVGVVQLVRSRTVEDYAIDVTSAIFFVFLFSVLITLYDRYRPVYDYRRDQAARELVTGV